MSRNRLIRVTKSAAALILSAAYSQTAVAQAPVPVTAREPFVDTGNEGAKELARIQGISVGEATSRLRRMHAAGLIAKNLADDGDPSFAAVSSDPSGITIYAKRTADGAASRVSRATRGVGAEFAAGTRFVEVPRSRVELQTEALAIRQRIPANSALVTVQINPIKSTVELLSTDPARTKAVAGDLPSHVTVVRSEPIRVLADAYGGTAANNGQPDCATFGFTVYRTSDFARGLLTVEHADVLTYNGYSTSNTATTWTSCNGGNSVYQQQQWSGDTSTSTNPYVNGQDFAWYTVSGYLPKPYFWGGQPWNGQTLTPVKGGKSLVAGDVICKFGRKTFRTCATVTGNLVYSPPWGWMWQSTAVAGTPQVAAVGDSGGPVVFSQVFAVGIVHAVQGTSTLLFANIDSLVQHNANIRVEACGC